MKIRTHYLEYQKTLSDTEKVIKDLKGSGLISAIEIEYQATNGATSCNDHEIHDDVSKIEVVDGAEVLQSLSMIEWIACNFYELGQIPKAQLSEDAAAVQKESCIILFGRFIGDPDYYFDPSKFDNPQLSLESALAISSTAGFATGSGKLTIKLHIIDEGANPQKGFITHQEKYSFASASSGDELISLPVNYPYQYIGVSAILTTKRPDEVISKIKLTFDDDKYIPINTYTDDIMDKLKSVFGLAQQHKDLLTADDGTSLLDIYDIKKAHIRTDADDHIATVEAVDAEKVSNGLYDMTTVGTPALQTTAKVCPLDVEGLCPHGMVLLTFGDIRKDSGILPVSDYAKLELYLTQAAASGAVKLVLAQIRG